MGQTQPYLPAILQNYYKTHAKFCCKGEPCKIAIISHQKPPFIQMGGFVMMYHIYRKYILLIQRFFRGVHVAIFLAV